MAGYLQSGRQITAVTTDWLYSIDGKGIHRSTPGYPGSQTHDREFAAPIKDYLKRNNLSVENIKSVKVVGKAIAYTWENDNLIFSLRTQTWNKE